MGIVKFFVVLSMIALVLPSGCFKSDKVEKAQPVQEARFTVLEQEKIGGWMFTAFLAKPDVSETEIVELFKEQLTENRLLCTSILIHVYATKEQYESKAGLWLAMMSYKDEDQKEEVTIDQEQLQSLQKGPEEKFGLSEEERKKIYWSIADDEGRATMEAIKAFPYLDDSQPGWKADIAAEQRKRQNRHRNKLTEQYRNEAPEKYKLMSEQLQEIAVEGGKKKWPVPPQDRVAELMKTCLISPQEANIVIDVCKVESIVVDKGGAVVFILHNKSLEPIMAGGRACGGEMLHIYAPKEPDGITPSKHSDLFSYRIKMKFPDGEKIYKNGDYIFGEPVEESEYMTVLPAVIAPQVPLSSGLTAGQEFYRRKCDEAAQAFAQAADLDRSSRSEEALRQYKDLLIRAKEAYATTNLTDKEQMRQIIVQSETRERELAEYLDLARIVRPNIRTPEDLADWIDKNIHYEKEHFGENYFQSPHETLSKRSGDCEDYAFLAQAFLQEIGIQSKVISVAYEEGSEKKGHAICVFERGMGYQFFSGSILKTAKAASIEQLVAQFYPDWYVISEIELSTKSRTNIARK